MLSYILKTHFKSRIFARKETCQNDCCHPWAKNILENSYSRLLLHLSITCGLQSSTEKCAFCYHQSNFQRFLPASDNRGVCGNQITERSSDTETVLGSSCKLGGAAKYLIGGSKKRICRLSFEFWSLCVIERCSKNFKHSGCIYHQQVRSIY